MLDIVVTECVQWIYTNDSEMIIFESILDKQASFFETAGDVAKIGSSLKPNHHKQI